MYKKILSMEKFLHHHPAHPPPVHIGNRPVILHVTVTTQKHCPILSDPVIHKILCRSWAESDRWRVGYYMIMPDHIHLFCAPGCHLTLPVNRWCRYWKRLAGQMYPRLRGGFVSDCWDTQMRSREHYGRKLAYLYRNPIRKGLVKRNEDWPYQGNMNSLVWLAE